MTVPATLDTVAVVGNGLIGHGMAQIFAAAGHRVVMIGRREESLAAATDRIAKSLAAFEAHGLVTSGEVSAALGRIRASSISRTRRMRSSSSRRFRPIGLSRTKCTGG